MKEVKFNYTERISDLKIICDTNVWYNIANQTFQKPENAILVPTSLTIAELSSSETMASSINLFQNVIKSLHENGRSIIPLDPFDFVLKNHDPKFPFNDLNTKKLLEGFSIVLSKNIPEGTEFSTEVKNKLIERCKQDRKATVEFAEFGSENLIDIRKNINKGVGKETHRKIDAEEINREMLKSFLIEHAKKVDYTIDFETFNWTNVEFFMIVTTNYFKKLETTRDMKIQPNDAVDWLNMLYVTPNDKYLTFEKSWRKIIQDDKRTANYLFT